MSNVPRWEQEIQSRRRENYGESRVSHREPRVVDRLSSRDYVDQRDRSQDHANEVYREYMRYGHADLDFENRRSYGSVEDDDSTSDSSSESEEEEEVDLTKAEKLKQLREAPIPLRQKLHGTTWKNLRDELETDLDVGDLLANSTRGFWTSVQSVYRGFKDFINRFALWNSKLKKVEGRFGSGVYNFFNFLKWAMGLNLAMSLLTVLLVMVPEHFSEEEVPECPSFPSHENMTMFPSQDVDTCCSTLYHENQELKRDPLRIGLNSDFFKDIGNILLNLLYGDGWMESTYLYYGKYSDFAGSYQMAVAYFFVIFCCFVLSLVRLVIHTAKYFKQGFKFNEFNSNQYFDLVFCYWDFSISSDESVVLARMAFNNEVRTALDTDKRQREESSRSTLQKIGLYLKRTIIWIIVLTLIFFFVILILYLYNNVQEMSNKDCGLEAKSWEEVESVALCYLKQYATTIAITLGNLLLPSCFYYLSLLEQYDPKHQLMVDLIRNIVTRLMGLMVIIGGHIQTNNCKYVQTEVDGQAWVACDNSNYDVGLSAGHAPLNSTGGDPAPDCLRRLCWETSAGVEFYRLTVLDLLTQVLIILAMDIPRVKCFARIEFNIPKHVLDIVYSQTICWMGLFFAPLLSMITFIKMLLLFYIRLSYLKNLCQPTKTFYEASRTSSLLNIFLLVSFVFSFVPMGIIMGEMQPSNACGPFRTPWDSGSVYYTGVVWDLVNEWSNHSGKQFFLFISRTSVLIVVSAGLAMLSYFTYLNHAAHREYNHRIEKQLKEITQETRLLTKELNRRMDQGQRRPFVNQR